MRSALNEMLSGPDGRLSTRSILATITVLVSLVIAACQAAVGAQIDIAGVGTLLAFAAACLGMTTYTTKAYQAEQADVAKAEIKSGNA